MSVDHGVYNSPESERPVFLDVAPGMTMIAKHDYLTGEKADKDWWMGQVIHWVKADLVTHIFPRAPEQ